MKQLDPRPESVASAAQVYCSRPFQIWKALCHTQPTTGKSSQGHKASHAANRKERYLLSAIARFETVAAASFASYVWHPIQLCHLAAKFLTLVQPSSAQHLKKVPWHAPWGMQGRALQQRQKSTHEIGFTARTKHAARGQTHTEDRQSTEDHKNDADQSKHREALRRPPDKTQRRIWGRPPRLKLATRSARPNESSLQRNASTHSGAQINITSIQKAEARPRPDIATSRVGSSATFNLVGQKGHTA